MPKTLTSRTALLFGAAMLLATTAVGVTLAAAPGRQHGQSEASESYGEPGHRRFADEHSGRRYHEGRQEGRYQRHAEADDDDDDEGEHGFGPAPRMADPNAPVPNNGLFNGKARPKVDVQ